MRDTCRGPTMSLEWTLKYRLKFKLLHHLELDAESEERFHEEFYFEIMLLNLQMMMIHQVRDQWRLPNKMIVTNKLIVFSFFGWDSSEMKTKVHFRSTQLLSGCWWSGEVWAGWRLNINWIVTIPQQTQPRTVSLNNQWRIQTKKRVFLQGVQKNTTPTFVWRPTHGWEAKIWGSRWCWMWRLTMI